jgi:hypothetical protein
MLSLRTSFLLALGLTVGFGTTQAADNLQNATITATQPSSVPLRLAEKFSARRRGECGTPPNVWSVNLCEAIPFCYVTEKRVSLWLPAEQRSGRTTDRLVIKDPDSQQEVELRWPASLAVMDWPFKQLPIHSGTSYLIKLKEDSNYHEIILQQVPPEITGVADKVAWMKQRGCVQQAEMLLDEQNA